MRSLPRGDDAEGLGAIAAPVATTSWGGGLGADDRAHEHCGFSQFSGASADASGNALPGEVAEIVFLGEALECRVTAGGSEILARLHPSKAFAPGDKVLIHIRPGDVAVLNA